MTRSAVSHVTVLPTSSKGLGALNVIYQTEILERSISLPAEVNYAGSLLILKYSPRNILPVSLSVCATIVSRGPLY